MKLIRNTIFLYIFFLISLFIFEPDYSSNINILLLTLYISFFLLSVLAHFIKNRHNKNWFRLDVLFILGFGIVHFQWPIMCAFSNIQPNLRFEVQHMNYGTWLSTLGVVSWLIGYDFLFTERNKYNTLFLLNYTKLFWFTLLSYMLFLLNAGSDFLSGSIYKGSGTGGVAEGIGVYFQLLTGISIAVLTTIVILDSKNKYKSNLFNWLIILDKKYLILASSYIALFLSIGDRGGAMELSLSFLVLIGQLIRPIKLKEFILIAIIGAVILTLIGLGRSSDADENILIAGANNADITSGYDVTLELANSVRTLYKALSEVPEHHNYFYGKLWMSKLLATVPFAQNIYLELTGDIPYELGSAGYITYLTFGLNPTSGEGTTIVADIFLNFGLPGVMFFLFLLGMFFKKLQNELITQNNYYWIIAGTVLASVALYMGRGSLFDGLRPILWALVLPVFLIKKIPPKTYLNSKK